jgi:Trk-type K+ transport system membrane component
MKTIETKLDRAVKALGSAMMILWFVILGAAGFLLLLGAVAAMVTHSYTLALVACFLLGVPLLCTLIWGLLGLAVAVRDAWATMDELDLGTSWERSQGLRVVYQAYFT